MSKTKFKRAYLGGTFDCLHRGHIALFRAAKEIANEVAVSVNRDEFATRYKRRPLTPLDDRLAVIGQIRLVDRVLVNVGDEDSRPAILRSGADCIVHGSDWQGDSLMAQMHLTHEWLNLHGITMVVLPYTEGVSTTKILQGVV